MMRRPAFVRAQRREEVGEIIARAAPTAGWNAKDPEASMPPEYAIQLENWFPTPADVVSRKGRKAHLTGVSGSVLSLMTYANPLKTEMFAVTATGVFDASVAGAVGSSKLAVTNGQMHYVNMNSLGGSYLMAVNGTDSLVRYDGTTWMSITAASTPAITGKLTSEFSNIAAHKRRLYFVGKDSMSMWYLPVNTIAGAVTEFPMGQLFTRGGKLVAMGTWTIDGGSGVDDYAVFITSEGEVAVYKGSDPSDANNWALVGVYFVGKPIGAKCIQKYDGDLLILTQVGVYPLSKALQSASVNTVQALSDRISTAFLEATSLYSTNPGWEMCIFPKGSMILTNIPIVSGTSSQQYVMNSVTQAWCKFTAWDAFCFTVFNDKLYFGTAGSVQQAWIGDDDAGDQIVCQVQCAYDYFSTRKRRKHLKLVYPHFSADGGVKVELGVSVDFEPVAARPLNVTSFIPQAVSYYGSALWGSSTWSGLYGFKRDWKTVFTPEGYAFSFRAKITNNRLSVHWAATDFIYQSGSIF